MKKIGKEVLFIPDTEINPRNGEGAFIRLKDGRIMYAYTKYNGGGGKDHDTAYIAAVYSSDEGESWSEDSVLYAKPKDAINVMSVSLLRMNNGDLGLICLRKDILDGVHTCIPYLYLSHDEGKTFDEGIPMINDPGYYVLNNDRVIRLKSGRILFAVAHHKVVDVNSVGEGVIEVYYSDDDGKSFKKVSGASFSSPFKANELGFMEPGLLELTDGRIWLYIRTAYGYQYQAFSEDGGENWSVPEPNFKLTSPSAPMLAKHVDKYTLAVLNPMPLSCVFTVNSHWWSHKLDRTPLVCAVSLDGGESLVDQDYTKATGEFLPFVERCYFLEDDFDESYCYPSILEMEDGFLVAYYFSNGSGMNLRAARITKVYFSELE